MAAEAAADINDSIKRKSFRVSLKKTNRDMSSFVILTFSPQISRSKGQIHSSRSQTLKTQVRHSQNTEHFGSVKRLEICAHFVTQTRMRVHYPIKRKRYSSVSLKN